MEEWLPPVKKSPLFYDTNGDKLYTLLKCCASEQVLYKDGGCIFRMEESVNTMLVLLRGKACIIQGNFRGHQEHMYHIREGELFGQSYSCIETPVPPVSAVAEGGCEALFLDYQRMTTFCPLACDLRTRFMHNMLRLVSKYDVKLENRLKHVCRRTTREKLLSYLSEQAMVKRGKVFNIPYNRQELAEYLCVDRSTMSSELSKTRAEGILDFRKNHFVLHDRDTRERGEEVRGQSVYQNRYLLKRGDSRQACSVVSLL